MLTATDKGTVRIVVICVGLLALACVGGVIALAATSTSIPSTLEVTTGVAVGGLVGLLSSTRSGAGGAEAVQAAVLAQNVVPFQPLPEPGVDGQVARRTGAPHETFTPIDPATISGYESVG